MKYACQQTACLLNEAGFFLAEHPCQTCGDTSLLPLSIHFILLYQSKIN